MEERRRDDEVNATVAVKSRQTRLWLGAHLLVAHWASGFDSQPMADAIRMVRVVAWQAAEALADRKILVADGARLVTLRHAREQSLVAHKGRDAREHLETSRGQ